MRPSAREERVDPALGPEHQLPGHDPQQVADRERDEEQREIQRCPPAGAEGQEVGDRVGEHRRQPGDEWRPSGPTGPSSRMNAGVASDFGVVLDRRRPTGLSGPSAPDPARKLKARSARAGRGRTPRAGRTVGPRRTSAGPGARASASARQAWRAVTPPARAPTCRSTPRRCSSVTSGVKFVDSRMLGSSMPKASISTGSSIAAMTSSLAQP